MKQLLAEYRHLREGDDEYLGGLVIYLQGRIRVIFQMRQDDLSFGLEGVLVEAKTGKGRWTAACLSRGRRRDAIQRAQRVLSRIRAFGWAIRWYGHEGNAAKAIGETP